jgi:hypothetical protein
MIKRSPSVQPRCSLIMQACSCLSLALFLAAPCTPLAKECCERGICRVDLLCALAVQRELRLLCSFAAHGVHAKVQPHLAAVFA